MAYPANVKTNPLGIYISAFILTSLILIADLAGVINFVRFPLESIIVPPRTFIYSIKKQIDDNIRIIFTPNLEAKLLEVDEKDISLEVLASKIQLLEEENASLRAQLETPLPPSWDYIPASILGKDRYIIVDKGEADKVKVGMAVVYKDVFIGRVKNANVRTSQIEILTDSELKIPAKTNKNVKGLLTGEFGNEIILTRILQKDPVSSFDTVLTSGEEGGVPANLVVGKISEVVSNDGGVYKQAKVDPILDYEDLSQLFIISSF